MAAGRKGAYRHHDRGLVRLAHEAASQRTSQKYPFDQVPLRKLALPIQIPHLCLVHANGNTWLLQGRHNLPLKISLIARRPTALLTVMKLSVAKPGQEVRLVLLTVLSIS